MKYYLNNPLSNNGIKKDLPEGCEVLDATKIEYQKFFDELKPEDEVVIVGGDGSLNHLVNYADCEKIKNNVYLYANGSGDDFLRDINETRDHEVLINKYLVKLPVVHVKGRDVKYLNNMSFGLDGYCCEEADRIKAKTPNKKINYSSIAIKGLLFKFKPKHAWVKVDDKEYEFDNVWLAPTMHGRYVGGGMIMAPEQDRFSDHLTLVIYSSKSKLESLMLFPSIFKGEHVKNKKVVKTFTGKKISVRFDEPCAVQIDGDTVLDVTEYTTELK